MQALLDYLSSRPVHQLAELPQSTYSHRSTHFRPDIDLLAELDSEIRQCHWEEVITHLRKLITTFEKEWKEEGPRDKRNKERSRRVAALSYELVRRLGNNVYREKGTGSHDRNPDTSSSHTSPSNPLSSSAQKETSSYDQRLSNGDRPAGFGEGCCIGSHTDVGLPAREAPSHSSEWKLWQHIWDHMRTDSLLSSTTPHPTRSPRAISTGDEPSATLPNSSSTYRRTILPNEHLPSSHISCMDFCLELLRYKSTPSHESSPDTTPQGDVQNLIGAGFSVVVRTGTVAEESLSSPGHGEPIGAGKKRKASEAASGLRGKRSQKPTFELATGLCAEGVDVSGAESHIPTDDWFYTSIDLWYNRCQSPPSLKASYIRSIDKMWSKDWAEAILPILSPNPSLGNTSEYTLKILQAMANLCALDSAIQLFDRARLSGRQRYLSVVQLRELARRLAKDSLQDVLKSYVISEAKTLDSDPISPCTTVPMNSTLNSTINNHEFDVELGEIRHWPTAEAQDEIASTWRLEPHDMEVVEGEDRLSPGGTKETIPVATLTLVWTNYYPESRLVAVAPSNDNPILQIIATASRFGNQAFSSMYTDKEILNIQRWDDSPYVMIRHADSDWQERSLCAEQLDEIVAANSANARPDKGRTLFTPIMSEKIEQLIADCNDLGQMSIWFDRHCGVLRAGSMSCTNEAMHRIWLDANVRASPKEVDQNRSYLRRRVATILPDQWFLSQPCSFQRRDVQVYGTILSLWSGFAIIAVRRPDSTSDWACQLCIPSMMIAIPPNVDWAWYDLTRTVVKEQYFDHPRLLHYALGGWKKLEDRKPWNALALTPAERMLQQHSNLRELFSAMMTTLWSFYGCGRENERSGFSDVFSKDRKSLLLICMEKVLSLPIWRCKSAKQLSWDEASEINTVDDLGRLLLLANVIKPLLKAQLRENEAES